MNLAEKICYLCGATKYQYRPGKVRDDKSLKIVECLNCGLVFLSQIELPTDFYEQSRMHGGEPLPIELWLRETRKDDERRFRYLNETIINRDILDFGCGNGGFLKMAQSYARKVAGIEMEKRLHSYFKTNGLNIFQNIDALDKSERFDLITAFHVIEHLQDPAKTLQKLAEKLSVGGCLIVEVPSSADALLTLYESVPFSEFTYWSCHLYLFNSSNLELLAKKAELKLDYVSHIQRYPLSNHLYWLSKGKPGGHQAWSFLDDVNLTSAYEARLAGLGKTDTLIASFSR